MPQKSATTTNTNSPLSSFIIEPCNSPPPSTEGFFMPPQMPPSTEGFFMLQHKAPSHTMQSTLPHHAEHPSTPCRTPIHIIQSMLPRPPNAPSRHTPAGGRRAFRYATWAVLARVKVPTSKKKVPRHHVGTASLTFLTPLPSGGAGGGSFPSGGAGGGSFPSEGRGRSPPPCRGGGLGGRGCYSPSSSSPPLLSTL